MAQTGLSPKPAWALEAALPLATGRFHRTGANRPAPAPPRLGSASSSHGQRSSSVLVAPLHRPRHAALSGQQSLPVPPLLGRGVADANHSAPLVLPNAGAFKDNMDAIDTKDFNRASTGKCPPNSFRILLGVWTVVADEDMNLVALRRLGTVKGAGRKLHDKDRFF